ncbi:MAG: SelT/SelW/SelH family protein [Gemmatimonadales bacterium]|nr:SelT/SelW/SelH family protein [Gemmatimonadales bacterium]
MAAELNQEFPEAETQLIESSGGRFEVEVDGELVFSKQKLGRHADPGEVVSIIKRGRG